MVCCSLLFWTQHGPQVLISQAHKHNHTHAGTDIEWCSGESYTLCAAAAVSVYTAMHWQLTVSSAQVRDDSWVMHIWTDRHSICWTAAANVFHAVSCCCGKCWEGTGAAINFVPNMACRLRSTFICLPVTNVFIWFYWYQSPRIPSNAIFWSHIYDVMGATLQPSAFCRMPSQHAPSDEMFKQYNIMVMLTDLSGHRYGTMPFSIWLRWRVEVTPWITLSASLLVNVKNIYIYIYNNTYSLHTYICSICFIHTYTTYICMYVYNWGCSKVYVVANGSLVIRKRTQYLSIVVSGCFLGHKGLQLLVLLH